MKTQADWIQGLKLGKPLMQSAETKTLQKQWTNMLLYINALSMWDIPPTRNFIIFIKCF